MTLKFQCDVVIIGGGLAGMVAASELLDAGRKVVIVDRDLEENFGGLAKESFGGMFFVDTPEQRRGGIRDSAELARRDWYSFAEFETGDYWPRRWADLYVEQSLEQVYHWLKSKGVGFFPVVHWVERGLFTPGNSVPRFHMIWGTGHHLTEAIAAYLEGHVHRDRLTLLFGHRVEGLVSDQGCISGCRGKTEADGQEFEVEAGCTIVAAGGINGDMDRVRANWHRDWSSPPKGILNGSHHFADGLVHDAAAECGAAITHLDRMWNYAAGVTHPRPKRPNHGLSMVPPRSALWLNSRGERIGPEPMITGFDTRRLVTQVCAQEKQFSWQVLNRKIAVKELAVSGSEFNEAIRDRKIFVFLKNVLLGNRGLVEDLTENCVDFVVAQSIDQLADRMNELCGNDDIDPAVLHSTIEGYDGNIERGPKFFNDDQLRRLAQLRRYKGDKARTCKFQRIDDAKARPLIAIREFILSRKTLGGLQTDVQSRVLDGRGEVIPGLYAAGEAAGFGGGGSHGLRALEGTFLGCCVLTARKAVEHIVK